MTQIPTLARPPCRPPACLVFVIETNKKKHGQFKFSLLLNQNPTTGLYTSPLTSDVCPNNIFLGDKELLNPKQLPRLVMNAQMNDAVPSNEQLMKISARTLKQIRLSVFCTDVKTASAYRIYEQINVNLTPHYGEGYNILKFDKDVVVCLMNKYATPSGKFIAAPIKIELGRTFIDMAQVEVAKMVRDMNERIILKKRKRQDDDKELQQQQQQQPTRKAKEEETTLSTPPKKRYRVDINDLNNLNRLKPNPGGAASTLDIIKTNN